MKISFMGIAVSLAIVVGALFALGFIAFGQARCTGINVWAAMTLAVITVIVNFTVFHALDWINDAFASKFAKDAVAETMSDMTKAMKMQQQGFKNLAQEHRARQALLGGGDNSPTPGVDVDDGMFGQFPGEYADK